uniref:Uncharacterized protein n=1 Tax=Mesocestoides corti TaxID=53468 RepID=A0A5K3FEB9_MESCO
MEGHLKNPIDGFVKCFEEILAGRQHHFGQSALKAVVRRNCRCWPAVSSTVKLKTRVLIKELQPPPIHHTDEFKEPSIVSPTKKTDNVPQ